MSVERSFEAWEEVAATRAGLSGSPRAGFHRFDSDPHQSAVVSLAQLSQFEAIRPRIPDPEFRIGQAGADFGACLDGMVHQFFRSLPVPFRHDDNAMMTVRIDSDKINLRADLGMSGKEDLGPLTESRSVESDSGSDGLVDEELAGLNLRSAGLLGRPQGILNTTTTYDSRTRELESSLVARGDLWRVEASQGSSTSRNGNSLFLVQLGPVLFVRDATLLLPVHLSKQHLLWYGYDRKNGLHSLCPAVVVKTQKVALNVNALSEPLGLFIC
ncbi:hypothetical protein M0R45_002390 [Rubus argutus]|uniref:Uncharacterized protein n=1 Tax=Rubus argutus TaxID=59490 RepID=A0AAW1VNZ7_RUBAR